MFTYAELISLQSAMTDKITRSKRILNEATHLDTIEGMREILEGCLNDDIRTLKKIEQLIAEY